MRTSAEIISRLMDAMDLARDFALELRSRHGVDAPRRDFLDDAGDVPTEYSAEAEPPGEDD